MAVYHELRRRWLAGDRMHEIALRAGPPVPVRRSPGGQGADLVEGEVVPDLPETVRYAELDVRVRRAAAWLRSRGVGHGDVVALQQPRSLAFLELHLACLALGACSLTLNDAYPAAEVAFYLADARPRLAVLVAVDGAAGLPVDVVPAADVRAGIDAAEPLPMAFLPEPGDDVLACLLYTSGTTGRPKGAMISHRNLRATVNALHLAWRWSRADHLLHALPLFHVHGLFAAQHGALWAGATATWLSRFDADVVLQTIADRRITVFMGVPTFHHRLLALPPRDADLSSLRLVTSGSAPLPAADHVAFRERFGVDILERYGMTEVGLVLSNPYDGERRPGAVGFPVPGVSARITDPTTGEELPPGEVGEIRIHGDSVISGYLNLPEQSAAAIEDGWMHTGDLGFVDDDGYFHVVGRQKDMVISGGLNVYPSEVEAVLRDQPGVAEVAVVGIPDDDLGERVVALVVPQPGGGVDAAALIAACRERLAPYKCPKELRVAGELPRNAMGKVQKQRIRSEW
ncbi:MAG: AMP-binding protein [Alphaproteobacteria bacterium]|nr:AMP-binding protein [Alphaproteobacteria bacterium]